MRYRQIDTEIQTDRQRERDRQTHIELDGNSKIAPKEKKVKGKRTRENNTAVEMKKEIQIF